MNSSPKEQEKETHKQSKEEHEASSNEKNRTDEYSDEETHEQVGHNEDDLGLPADCIEIIRSLILLAPPPSCRETRKLLSTVGLRSIKETYSTVFTLTKASNKELVHYLGVVLEYPHPQMDLEALVNLRLTAQDKYMSQAVHIYLTLVDSIYSSLSMLQKLKIFYRYIYIFNTQICLDISLFHLFSRILREDFLMFFVSKRFFVDFPFLKEFIIHFGPALEERVVGIGYEISTHRKLVYHTARYNQRKCAPSDGSALSELSWIEHRWGVQTQCSIPELFYQFDCAPLMESLGAKKFQSLENAFDQISQDLQRAAAVETCAICKTTHQIGEDLIQETESHLYEKVCGLLNAKQQIATGVDTFNRTGAFGPELDLAYVRLLPAVDLKRLGEYLGKEKNIHQLRTFTESFEFTNTSLVDALRVFLCSFILPGESQVIYRVIETFAGVYVSQNHGRHPLVNKPRHIAPEEALAPHREKCKKIAYGFIVLNTMFHNPLAEKKPSFEDYLKFTEFEESSFLDEENFYFSYSREDLKEFYENIKENEFKAPTGWSDGFDKFCLFKRCLDELSGYFPFNRGEPTRTDKPGGAVCKGCVVVCYRHLFRQSAASLYFLPPQSFFGICNLLNTREVFKSYIVHIQKDVARVICACRLFLENFPADPQTATIALDALERAERPRGTVLTDFKAILSKSFAGELGKTHKTNQQLALPQFSTVVSEFANMKFVDRNTCMENLKILEEAAASKRALVKDVLHRVTLSNCELLNTLSFVNIHTQIDIIGVDPGRYLSMASDEAKLKFMLTRLTTGQENEQFCQVFLQISLINQDTFDVFCLLQQSHDIFDRFIQIEKKTGEGTHEGSQKTVFVIHDRFGTLSDSFENVRRLCSCSSSILNLKVAKKIHKTGCPLNDPLFNDFDKLVYLLLKANKLDKAMSEYAVCVVNYLSDSLVLLVKFYEFAYPLFFQLSGALVSLLMKILVKRIKTFVESGVACCEESKDPSISQRTRRLVQRLISDQILEGNDIKALSLFNKPKYEAFDL